MDGLKKCVNWLVLTLRPNGKFVFVLKLISGILLQHAQSI